MLIIILERRHNRLYSKLGNSIQRKWKSDELVLLNWWNLLISSIVHWGLLHSFFSAITQVTHSQTEWNVKQGLTSVSSASLRVITWALCLCLSPVLLSPSRCGSKQGEEDYRPLFENFVQDLLSTVNKPEWPAAELLLSLLGRLLVCVALCLQIVKIKLSRWKAQQFSCFWLNGAPYLMSGIDSTDCSLIIWLNNGLFNCQNPFVSPSPSCFFGLPPTGPPVQ